FFIYTSTYLFMLFKAKKGSPSPKEVQKFTLLFRGSAIGLALYLPVNLLLSRIPLLQPMVFLPSIITLLIWAFTIRLATIKHDFLPSFSRKYEVLFEHSPVAVVLLDSQAQIVE